ncbi:hypothetical protein PDIP_84810 [Penicillium digitatum Pd1]|uniref:Uncharacterized protein n=1 Tax=Penicillium digitatum (strain Pd1 / CECT 20795) TaxID=1170230 RepID=K9F7M3_PEND1|nr:hypothetical protein PDIP_84810 [Penicillium digitatum Pd1]EKV05119.1 hypothetical protein PDIP_84810 [Penicillium digitatum Pd1]
MGSRKVQQKKKKIYLSNYYIIFDPITDNALHLLEKCLNKTSDVDIVLNHYSSLGFQPENSTTSAANNIVGFITNQFYSQVSIFKSNESDQNIKPTRKNGQKTRIHKKRNPKTSKRTGKNPQFHSPRPAFCQPSGQSA